MVDGAQMLLRRLARLKKFKDGKAPEVLIANEEFLVEEAMKKCKAKDLLQVVERFDRYFKSR